MHQVYLYDDTLIELTEQQFFLYLFGQIESLDNFVENFGGGLYGYPDITGETKEGWDKRGSKNLQNLLPLIENATLQKSFQLLGILIQDLYRIDAQLVYLVATFFDFPTPLSKEDSRKLAKKINAVTERVWTKETEYQQLTQNLHRTIETARKTKQQIDEILKPQLSTIPEYQEHIKQQEAFELAWAQSNLENGFETDIDLRDEILDELEAELRAEEDDGVDSWQFAQDLIDRAEGEFNPRRAIQILHLSLRHQSTGVLANEAYMGLGMKYEQLGLKTEAIDCYTKALEEDRPDARLFLWRGEIRYELGEWNKAKSDFEQALAISSSIPGELFEDDRESAEKYLSKLAEILKNE